MSYHTLCAAPTVTGVDFKVKGSLHTLVCSSTGSPATSVLWAFNNEPISTSLDNSLHISESKLLIVRNLHAQALQWSLTSLLL